MFEDMCYSCIVFWSCLENHSEYIIVISVIIITCIVKMNIIGMSGDGDDGKCV